MKYRSLLLLITTLSLFSCTGQKTENRQTESQPDIRQSPISLQKDKSLISVRGIVDRYLQIKNALVKDNSSEAATFGGILQGSLKNFDKTGMTSDQKKTFENLAEDAIENAEHISESGKEIEHQREHFEMLSKDIYDLVKAFYAGEVLYKEFCPMYNKGKGAFWLSDSKEILNPYYGKEMLTCGTVLEELN